MAGMDDSSGSLADISMANLKTRHPDGEGSNTIRNGNSASSNGPGRATSPDPVISAHITSLRLLFTAWLSHFRSLGYIKETTLDTLDKTVLRQTLQLSVRSPSARLALGSEPKIWSDLLSLLRVAIASIESRSYATIPDPYDPSANPTSTVYDGPSANVVVQNSQSLLRDLQRLNNILCIGRNILTAGVTVQNLAAQTAVDREVCCLINLCVKVTARGYDGDGTASEEERWQAVVNEYKKILITCLQFVSNLVTLNERLKLMLWVELFDPASEGNVPPYPDPAGAVRPPQPEMEKSDRWVASKIDGTQDSLTSPSAPVAIEQLNAMSSAPGESSHSEETSHEDKYPNKHSPERARSRTPISPRGIPKPVRPHMAYFTFLEAQKETVRRNMRQELGKESPMVEVLAEATRIWERLPHEGKAPYNDQYNEALEKWKLEVEVWRAAGGSENTTRERDLSQRRAQEKWRHILGDVADANDGVEGARGRNGEGSTFGSDLLDAITSVSPVQRPMESAEDGIRKLEEGKSELLKRLEHNASIPATNPNAVSPQSPVTSPISSLEDPEDDLPLEQEEHFEQGGAEDDGLDEEVDLCSDEGEEEEDQESCSDDYDRIPGEDGRGLLTDIPLILGPNEIEVLPMIVMSGIVCDPAQIAQRKTEVAEANFIVDAQDTAANTSTQVSAPSQKKTPDEALQTLLNMYTIRCHLLLAQENGRNLLRELLIFVAAWDLREEELYFKFMVKIMESILLHGLMPFAYNAFKESKDVISPAQAVIMKLLTKIFHARAAFAGGASSGSTNGADKRVNDAAASDFQELQNNYYVPPNWPKNRDGSLATSGISYMHPVTGNVHLDPTRAIVASLIAEFRGSIIPQICALIFLQGQIRQGKASLDDFPLNLWDMERMYEGVYQYLEFFAILTDCEEWKNLLAGWEIISELVTLLRELEVGIGKGRMGSRTSRQYTDHQDQSAAEPNPSAQIGSMQPPAAKSASQQHEAHQEGLTPVAVERPYCAEVLPKTTPLVTRNTHAGPSTLPLPTPPSAPPDGTAYPPTQRLPLIPGGVPGTVPCLPSIPSVPLPPHEEPALFEWRNLKKLCVLVLSSLVWKNRTLQDQMLRFGGVEAVLRCCQQGNDPGFEAGIARPHGTGLNVDEHNPYIREHAIMCLRFCCEGNLEVQEFIKNIVKNSERVENLAKNAEMGRGAIFDQSDSDGYGFERENILKVPPEVLDAHGYETFMDQKGQVGLRRKKSRARGGGATSGSTSSTTQRSTSASAASQNKAGPEIGHHPHHHHHSGQLNHPHHHHHPHQQQAKQQKGPRPLPRPATPPPRGPRALDVYDSEDESWVEEAERWRTGLAAVGGDRDAVPLSMRPGYESGYVHVEGAWGQHAGANGSPITAAGQADALQQGRDPIQAQIHARAQESEEDLVEEKPRTAADLPAWVERITRDLPHRRLERDRAMAAAAGRDEGSSPRAE